MIAIHLIINYLLTILHKTIRYIIYISLKALLLHFARKTEKHQAKCRCTIYLYISILKAGNLICAIYEKCLN